MRLARRLGTLAALTLPMAGCAEIGPDYQRPAAIVPAAYKEIKGWKPATPRDAEIKGAWWTAFHDPALNRLEAQVALAKLFARFPDMKLADPAAPAEWRQLPVLPRPAAPVHDAARPNGPPSRHGLLAQGIAQNSLHTTRLGGARRGRHPHAPAAAA